MRAIFFDQDSARAVASRLVRDGYSAQLVRERLAGEDDDEDHPWAVVGDAPSFVLELYVDEYDGWLDDDPAPDPGAPATAPLPLPTEPRRIKRPDHGH